MIFKFDPSNDIKQYGGPFQARILTTESCCNAGSVVALHELVYDIPWRVGHDARSWLDADHAVSFVKSPSNLLTYVRSLPDGSYGSRNCALGVF